MVSWSNTMATNAHTDTGTGTETELDAETSAWCNYIRTTPEPTVIAYNRIGKCGSSTMERIIDRQVNTSRQYEHDLHAWHTDSSFWTQPGKHPQQQITSKQHQELLREHVLRTVDEAKQGPGTRLIVDGHWNLVDLASGHLRDGSPPTAVQYIQLSRSCEPRIKSHLLYHLHDSVAAQHAKRTGHYRNFIGTAMGIPGGTVQMKRCLSNYSCLADMPIAREVLYDGAVLDYFCDADCVRAHRFESRLAGAMQRVRSPKDGGYAVVGVLEELNQFLELLECAFPGAFQGAAMANVLTPIHSNNSTVHSSDGSNAALDRFAHGTCITESHLYDQILTTAARRHKAMKAHPERCCRPRIA